MSSVPFPGMAALAAQHNLIPLIREPEIYDTMGMTLAFLKEKVKDFVKALGYLAFWTNQAVPDLPPGVAKFSLFASRDVKNMISATEFPDKVIVLLRSIYATFVALADKITGVANSSWEQVGTAARKAFLKDATALVNTVNDSLEVGRQCNLIEMSMPAIKMVSGISLAATAIGSSNDVVENIQKLCQVEDPHNIKTPLFLMKLASAVSYVALGVIGLYGLLTATIIAPWVFVACLTSALTFTISGFFWEKMYDPEGKGLNRNPAIVMENMLRQDDFQTRLAAAVAAAGA